ncbi:MAG: tyrosine-type recombinase/integrase [Verrucomicrobiae bacterium]|nr:tyrosine-type recombinase/integrase [Verrucomicrobiae bacterium]
MHDTERFAVKQIVYRTGTPTYRIQGRMPDGKQVRKNVQTFHEALQVKEELELKARGQPVEFVLRKTRLTQDELAEAEHAIRRLRDAQTVHPHLKGKSLQFVVDFALANYKEPTITIKVADAVEQFLQVKRVKKRRHRTITNLVSRLNKLVRAYGDRLVSEITMEHLEGLMNGCDYGAISQNHYRTTFRSFFGWCRKRKYCTSNPAEDIEVADVDDRDPEILTLDQAKALLQAAYQHKEGVLAPFVVLGLFCGLRPAEIGRLKWKMVNLTAKIITVTGGAAKKRKRRHVELCSNVVEWLTPMIGNRIMPKNFRRHFDAVRRLAGFRGSVSHQQADDALLAWPHDAIRHTAISCHFAAFEDEGKTAKWAGQSVDVMHNHYKGLVIKADAEVFWSWTPTGIQSPEPKGQQVDKIAA